MGEWVHISIPCKYVNRVLTIKALGFKAEGDSPEQALLECIKNTALYVPLILAKFSSFTNWRGHKHLQIEVPYHSGIYDKMQEVEPFLNEAKKKAAQTFISEPSAAETLKYGW